MTRTLFLLGILSSLQFSCGLPDRPEGWTEETHGEDATANYEVVFAQAEVKRLDVTISSSNWQVMLDDMHDLLGEFGTLGEGSKDESGGPSGDPPTQDMIAACEGKAEREACTVSTDDKDIPGTCAEMKDNLYCSIEVPNADNPCQDKSEGDECIISAGSLEVTGTCTLSGDSLQCMNEGEMRPPLRNPVWVPCMVEFEGKTWWHVGIRFKGNSSLGWAWSNASYKLPLKFDFDEFEADHPEIFNQRFFGFKRLSLSNNSLDPSYLRDKVSGDVFREGGVPAPRRAFYRIFIDFGDGPVYFGLYTMAEVPSRPMFLTQFGDTGGNLYKPEGGAAMWKKDLPINEESFSKKTNENEADWSDVENAIAALHASREDPAVWRAGLEQFFDADGFLRWLAINTVIQDWDTYGNMSHNYYLYGDPADNGQLHWIPWDHNAAFMSGSPNAPEDEDRVAGANQPLSLDMSEVTSSWPLIRFLMDDPVYQEVYWSHVKEFAQGVFSLDSIKARFQSEHDLIASYVVGPEGEQTSYTALESPGAFEDSLEDLFLHVDVRHESVTQVLNEIH
jgi:hypothetical protein